MPCREWAAEEALRDQLNMQAKNNHYMTRLLCDAVRQLKDNSLLQENSEIDLWYADHLKFDNQNKEMHENLWNIAIHKNELLERTKERVLRQLTKLELRSLGLERD